MQSPSQDPFSPEVAVAIAADRGVLLVSEDGALLESDWKFGQPAPVDLSRQERAYWSSCLTEPTRGMVKVEALYEECAHWVQQALEATGIPVTEEARHRLVLTDDYLRPELDCIRGNWLLAKPVGHTIWLGPIFDANQNTCYACMAHWLRLHRWKQAAFCGTEPTVYLPQPSVAALPSTLLMASGWIATAVAHWLTEKGLPSLHDAILTLDTRTMRLHRHTVRSRRGCRCHKPHSPMVLRSYASSLMGVVTDMETANVPIGGVYHARAIGLLPLPVGTARDILEPVRASGKGETPQQAEDCCIAEALERYSTFYQGSESLVRAEAQQLPSIPPNRIQLFSDRQYRQREEWNQHHGAVHFIPEAAALSQPMEWVKAKSLHDDAIHYLPAALCYLGYPAELAPFAAADSSGCASASSLEEAISLALCELIERDAASIWWYNRLRRPGVRVEAFDSPRLLHSSREFAKLGKDLQILDLTTDIPVPVYAAFAAEAGSQPMIAFAAHPEAEVAAWKATSELAQLLFWRTVRGQAPQLTHMPDFLQPDGWVAPQGRSAVALPFGIDACFVDLTRDDIQLPTARVFAPGLRPLRARFAPGRLYDVPVKLGWRDRALAEEELNPIPFPL